MFALAYKGWSIQGHFERDAPRLVSPDYEIHSAKSVHAAKCFITRLSRGV